MSKKNLCNACRKIHIFYDVALILKYSPRFTLVASTVMPLEGENHLLYKGESSNAGKESTQNNMPSYVRSRNFPRMELVLGIVI
jgi:hypothetical protein